jgi:pilus assembly protein Flp/PilA
MCVPLRKFFIAETILQNYILSKEKTMLDFKKLFKKSEEKEEGQGLVEYALILFLVAVVVIAILILLGPQIGSVFSAVTKGLS